MTDRVRLLLEDGTVLADGVRPSSPVTRAMQIENRRRAAECEHWDRIMSGDGDSYDLRAIAPLPPGYADFVEAMMRRYSVWMHQYYFIGWNAVIHL